MDESRLIVLTTQPGRLLASLELENQQHILTLVHKTIDVEVELFFTFARIKFHLLTVVSRTYDHSCVVAASKTLRLFAFTIFINAFNSRPTWEAGALKALHVGHLTVLIDCKRVYGNQWYYYRWMMMIMTIITIMMKMMMMSGSLQLDTTNVSLHLCLFFAAPITHGSSSSSPSSLSPLSSSFTRSVFHSQLKT